MLKKLTLSAVSAMILSSGLMANDVVDSVVMPQDGGVFIGIGYGYFEQSVENIDYATARDVSYTSHSWFLDLGYRYNKYLAVEGRQWIGLGNVSQSGGLREGGVSDFGAWGAYVKPTLPLFGVADVYALFGYADTDVNLVAGRWVTQGFSWGIGGNYNLNEHASLFADFVSLGAPSNFTYKNGIGDVIPDTNADILLYTVNVGVTYKF